MSKYKGELTDFPDEVVEKMLEYQEEQGSSRNVSVFEKSHCCGSPNGFNWDETVEGWCFWFNVITNENFDLFFSRYPKKKEPIVGIFKVNDTVYSWRYDNIPGTVIEADYSNYKNPLIVEFSDGYGFKRKFSYRIDGGVSNYKPELSFVPYDLVNGGFSQKRPLPNLKKGDLIWVRSDLIMRGNWLYARFEEWGDNEVLVNYQSEDTPIMYFEKWSIECPIK